MKGPLGMDERLFASFSFDSYARLLDQVGQGRVNLRFSDFDGGAEPPRYLIVRHDIDYSPAAALAMARLEARLGIKASYFLLLTSEYYNLLSEPHRALPGALTGLGHEVGLHYDLAIRPPAPPKDVLQQIAGEASLLSQLSGQPVRSVSLHNPSLDGRDLLRGRPEYHNAYSDRFTKDIAYFSDSAGAWRDQSVAALISDQPPPRIQLLIHPLFWGRQHQDRVGRLDGLLGDMGRELGLKRQKALDLWAAHEGARQHDRRLRRQGARPAPAGAQDAVNHH